MVFYLLEGLKKSLVYSGLIDHEDVKPFYESVEKKLRKWKMKYIKKYVWLQFSLQCQLVKLMG